VQAQSIKLSNNIHHFLKSLSSSSLWKSVPLHCCCTLAAAMSVLFMIQWQKQTPIIEPYEIHICEIHGQISTTTI
jgi:hypothetical protein